MKKIVISIYLVFGFVICAKSQVAGNSIYAEQKFYTAKRVEPHVMRNNNNQVTIRVRGIYNELETRQVAYFSVVQLGEDIEDVNAQMDTRIKNVEAAIRKLKVPIEFYVDMISFIPLYEYEVEKKLFSKRTYNEIPKGFELKKNLHFSFSDGKVLAQLVAICAANEIYDLIKVEYVSKNFEAVQDALREQAKSVYQKTLKFHEEIMGMDFSKKRKIMSEGFNEVYPKDRYNSYVAFSTPNLQPKRRSVVKTAQKSKTLYYEPMEMVRKNFVIHPEILEPAIQVVYELEVTIQLNDPPKPVKQEPPKTINKYYLITPNGDFRQVPIN